MCGPGIDTGDASQGFDVTSIPFRGLVEQALAGVYIIQDEVFQYSNATWAAMTGHVPEQLIGQPVSRFVPPEDAAEVSARYHRRVSGIEPSMRFIVRGLHRDGSIVFIDVHGMALEYRGRPAVVGVGIEVTEQLEQTRQLQESRQQYQELAAYLIAVRERQRSAYAREVHDVLGGLLTSMKLNVGRILRRTDHGEQHEIREIADDLNGLLQEAINNVREISESLHPQALEYLGLTTAMASHLERFEKRSGIRVTMHPTELHLPLTNSRATMAYRILQEALTNIARHAQATEVTVVTAIDADMFRVDIRDNGIGMPLRANATPDLSAPCFGILSMKERARELGGTLSIDSAPGQGTCIVLVAPLDANEELPLD
ncbi:PAS domain-containing sensor histidine kinase [Noviherbaspirillum saxi]|uniref:PAS domain-containing sensor histidine kinase n=1 Tax=Noviherbaspirillum saxi TaxID=2320863 RepID=A0A3A3FUA2_9BURK|nr:PAS domain-containing sensor histidine kinase [Noviherbaspirillum saxi]RJF99797.1 PAS domain-containing sensor histidine kinase [Noviherbaspirillum saxi]